MLEWINRTNLIAATKAPPALAVAMYNKQAVTVLPYLMQLYLPSRKMCEREHYVLARLLHVPPSSFRAGEFTVLGQWGSPQPLSLTILSVATLIRTALKTTQAWIRARERLIDALVSHHGLVKAADPELTLHQPTPS